MKMLIVFTLLAATVAAQTAQQCEQVDFSGQASQKQKFSMDIGQGITFSVFPMSLREAPQWRWFQIRVIGGDAVFVFSPSDMNWLFATSFASAFIGGWKSDVKASLRYKNRYFVFPLSLDQKRALLDAASKLYSAEGRDALIKAEAILNATRLGQLKFDIDDYQISGGGGETPTSVDSVKFSGTLILPPDFQVAGLPSVTYVDCPFIPHEVFDDIRDPKRHEHRLPLQ